MRKDTTRTKLQRSRNQLSKDLNTVEDRMHLVSKARHFNDLLSTFLLDSSRWSNTGVF